MWFREMKKMDYAGEGGPEPQADKDSREVLIDEADGDPDTVREDKERLGESYPTQETEDEYGRVPTRQSLVKELQEAQEQVTKLKKILDLPDETIELFLGTERYL